LSGCLVLAMLHGRPFWWLLITQGTGSATSVSAIN
jgi:hypothetical protein